MTFYQINILLNKRIMLVLFAKSDEITAYK